ncbi:hypothetical protein Tco_0099197 [Tanacetum coccineum]
MKIQYADIPRRPIRRIGNILCEYSGKISNVVPTPRNSNTPYPIPWIRPSITAALIDVNAAQSKLVLLENFNENYSKCLRLLCKVTTAEGVNAAEVKEVSNTDYS